MLRGAAYEEGRIQQLELSPNDCGMKIKNVIQADNGDWHCNVTSKGIYNRLAQIILSERQCHYLLIDEKKQPIVSNLKFPKRMESMILETIKYKLLWLFPQLKSI